MFFSFLSVKKKEKIFPLFCSGKSIIYADFTSPNPLYKTKKDRVRTVLCLDFINFNDGALTGITEHL